MTASCRLQLATLKLKNPSKSEDPLKDTPNKTLQQTAVFSETNFTAQDTSVSKLNKSPAVFPNELKVSIEVSEVDSGINIGCSYNETWEGVPKKSEDVPFSHTAHFMVRDFNTAATENHITSLDQVTSVSDTGSAMLSEETLQIAQSVLVQDEKIEHEQTDMECTTISNNLNASISVKIINKDENFTKTSSINDVSMERPPNTESDAPTRNKTDPSNGTTDCSNALNYPSGLIAVSDSVQPMYEDDTAVGDCQKKRTCSESSNVPDAKRAKTSTSVLLDKVQCLIDRRIHMLFEETYDQKLETLMHQVNRIQRSRSRTNEIARHVRSINRLERRLKCAVHLQRQLGTKSTPISPIREEHCNTDATPNASTVTPPTEETESPSRPEPPLNPTPSRCKDLVVLSDNESEQPSNPEHPNSASKKVDSAAMHKIMESIMEHRRKAQTNKTIKTIIDLTDEEQKLDKEIKTVTEHWIPNGAVLASPEGNGGVKNVLDKCPAKKDLPLSNGKEASLNCDVRERKTSIPISPQSENPVKPKPEPTSLKPPQKPQLRLAQVQNPKGIALSWNITNVDPNCAPATAYCLYVHQGDPNNPKKQWKKIGEIKALPLPMACTLTQFVEDTTYSFAMRAKDGNGRFGPLCDIQSTTLKPLNSSKKS
ncbi:activating transcription factor 7-interacting protein 2 isoform X2 [Dendropsophus ebraccatus]